MEAHCVSSQMSWIPIWEHKVTVRWGFSSFHGNCISFYLTSRPPGAFTSQLCGRKAQICEHSDSPFHGVCKQIEVFLSKFCIPSASLQLPFFSYSIFFIPSLGFILFCLTFLRLRLRFVGSAPTGSPDLICWSELEQILEKTEVCYQSLIFR